MSITDHHRVPAPRPVRPVHTRNSRADVLRAATYQGFLYGFGAAPGVDLGAPVRYLRVGEVYRQEFERGVTLANSGDAPVAVDLGRPHLDAAGARRTRLTLPPRSAEVL